MQLLSRCSIETKLSLLTYVVTFSTAVFACFGFAGYGFYQQCAFEAQQLKNHARLLGHYSVPIVTLRNRKAGEQYLALLASDPSIEAAGLFDTEHNCLSFYGEEESMKFPHHMVDVEYRLASFSRLEILSQITVADQHIGYVYVRSNTGAAQARIWQFGRGAVFVFLVAISFGCVIAAPFKRAISRPILKLTKAVNANVGGNRPSIRLAGHVSPECIEVLRAVNCLLSKITESKSVTERATTQLADRVAESGRGLSKELKRLQERQVDLEESKDAAEAANMAKSSFVVDFSFEMRGPLDSIVDNVQQLQRNQQAPDQKTESSLEAIRRNGQQLQRLIQEVAEGAKTEMGHVEITRSVVIPPSIIASAIVTHKSQAEQKGLSFEYQWRGSEQESMCSDPERIRQIVQVLVDNAVRFTKVGGIRVVARFEQSQNCRQLCIEVTDTGIGIDREDLDQVFEPTGQPIRFSPDNREMIMGLHNCRRVVSALGGQMTVNSAVGEGSVFTVTINADDSLTPASTPGAPAASPTHLASDGQPSPFPGRMLPLKILVVDDSESERELTESVLQRAGANVSCVANGLQAVQAAIRQPYDLILMDLQMPGMDGYATTHEIRAQGVNVPIVALTGSSTDFDERECRASGCVGHLVKPVDAEGVSGVTEWVLSKGKPRVGAAR